MELSSGSFYTGRDAFNQSRTSMIRERRAKGAVAANLKGIGGEWRGFFRFGLQRTGKLLELTPAEGRWGVSHFFGG